MRRTMVTVSERAHTSGAGPCLPPRVPLLPPFRPRWLSGFYLWSLLFPLSGIAFFRVCYHWLLLISSDFGWEVSPLSVVVSSHTVPKEPPALV